MINLVILKPMINKTSLKLKKLHLEKVDEKNQNKVR
jgi:hypothetical protein